MTTYQYTECGLENVVIENADLMIDDKGQQVYQVRNIRQLHEVIASCIVSHTNSISGAELRFLRTEMGMTQAELAKHLHKELITIGRWERGEHPIDSSAEALIRLFAIERLDLKSQFSAVEAVSRCVSTAETQTIKIDGSDPEDYKAIAA